MPTKFILMTQFTRISFVLNKATNIFILIQFKFMIDKTSKEIQNNLIPRIGSH